MRMVSEFMTTRAVRRKRAATNVTLDAELVAQARKLGVSISEASNQGLERAVKKAEAERWLKENKPALDSYNEWIEANGLPLERHRLF